MARFGNSFVNRFGRKISFDFRDEQEVITISRYIEREPSMPWDSTDQIDIPREIFHDFCLWLGEYAKNRDKDLNFIAKD